MKGRILILANSSSGLMDFRGELLLRLKKEGFTVYVSVPDQRKVEELEGAGVIVRPVEMNRRGINPLQDLKLYANYRKLLKEVKPDAVLTYTIKPNVYGGFACRRRGIPYLSTVTGLGSAFERKGLLKSLVCFLYRGGLSGAEAVFFQNEENLHIFEELGIRGKRQVLVAGSGVDLKRHVPAPYPGHRDKVTRFLYVGRLMQEKGSGEFLETAKRMHAEFGDRVSFAAVGYAEGAYEEKAQEAKQEGILKLIPYQNDIRPYYREADAVVMPSYHEGMSNVLMEASATARPVLASNISGCKEIVEEGKSGFLFEKESAQALYEACLRFFRLDEESRRQMGLAARKKVEREFDRDRIIDVYMDEIFRAIHRKADRR